MKAGLDHRRSGRRLHAPLTLAALLLLVAPAKAEFGIDTPLTSGPWSRYLCANNAHSVAVDGKGNVHVIYGGFEFNHGYDQEVLPYYQMYDKELDVWEPEVRIADPADRVVCWWNVAIAGECNGGASMTWFQPGPGGGLLFRKHRADGSWDPIQVVPAAAGAIDHPSIAVDEHGDVFVCWAEGYENPGYSGFLFNVRCQVWDDQRGAWDPAVTLTSYLAGTVPSPGATQISVSVQGFQNSHDAVAHFAWADANAGHVGYTYLLRHCGDPATGGAPSYGPLPGTAYLAGNPGSPSIAVRCRQVHVVWDADGSLQHRIGTETGAPGTVSFAPAVATGLPAGDPNLTIDGLGNAHVISGGLWHARWSALLGAWSAATAVNDIESFAEHPSIAAGLDGDLHVVWMDGREPSAEHIYYDRGSCMVTPMQPDLPAPTLVQVARDLAAARASASPTDRLPVIVQMREQADLPALDRAVAGLGSIERRRTIVRSLESLAARTQQDLRDALDLEARAGEAESIRSLWLVNAVAAHLSPDAIDRLAARGDIASILYDPPEQLIEAPAAPGSPYVPAAPPPPRKDDPGDLRPPPPPDIAWNVSWIDAPTVWDMGYAGQCVLVAVLDTGVDLVHTDLVNRLWNNADDISGNGIDDDGNGYVDDVHGYDFANADGSPMDANGHGTHVAGSIAGDGSGGTVTGVAPEANVMAVQVCSAAGSCFNSDIIDGIQYAINNGAQVLNLSLGAYCADPATRRLHRLEADVVKATGVTMCVASGNAHCADSAPNEVDTPGDIPSPWINPDQAALGTTSGVTTVGATGYMTEDIAPFSNQGPVDWSQTEWPYGDWMLCDPLTPHVGLIKPDIVAPGTRIESLQLGGGYVGEDPPTLWSGTSMATPHVTGLVALLLSKNHELFSSDIEELIETNAVPLGPFGKDNTFGAGRITAPATVVAAPAPARPAIGLISHAVHDTPGGGNGDGLLSPGEDADLVVSLKNNGPYMLGDVVAQLAASAGATVLDDTSTYGDFLVNQVKANDADPFRIRIPADTPVGTVIDFIVTATGYGGCATVSFADTVRAGGAPCAHIADHDAGGVRFSVTDQGINGFLEGDLTSGSGFVTPKIGGTNRLYIGSFWAATDTTYALNRDYDADPVKDWNPLGCLTLRAGEPTDPVLADQVGIGSYDDSGNPTPRGIRVEQRSYAWASPPNDKWVIVTYQVTNQGSQTANNLWLGLFMDWDLDPDGGLAANMGATDASRDLVYMWRPSGGDGTYVGVRSLSHTHPLQMSLIQNATFVWPLTYITDRDHYHLLSGDGPAYRLPVTTTPDDYSAVIGVAPFRLDPGQSVMVAFAVLGGSGLADLRANADAAAVRWATNWGAPMDVAESGGVGPPTRIVLEAPSPNPFRNATTFTFTLPLDGLVRLEVFDVGGRRLSDLANGWFQAGRHAARWDGRDDMGRPVRNGVYYARLRGRGGSETQKLLLIR